MKMKEKRKAGIGIIFVTVIVTLAVVFFIGKKTEQKDEIEFEDNAVMGIMPGVDMEQRLLELQEKLDNGMIAFSVNTNPVFTSSTDVGNLMLENPGNNEKLLIAQVILQENQEVIYRSKYMKPGSYMEYVKLDKILDPGVYKAIVYFEAYTQESAEYIGKTGAEITITVQG